MEEKPRVLREVLADNASPMTGAGTTTYILGRDLVTVIDPGPRDPAHLRAIMAALAPEEKVEAILITHPHLDHSGLCADLKAATGAKVYGYGPAGSGRNAAMRALVASGYAGGGEGGDKDFTPDHALRGGERLDLACGAITALHTPGHMGEHLAFGWGDRLFCGDLVMAWAPSLVSPPDGDMGDFMASLRALQGAGWRQFLPTHGAVIEEPETRLAELIAHRLAREAQVLAALEAGPADLSELTLRVYQGLDPVLLPAAERNALAHLLDLIRRGAVKAAPWPSRAAIFTRI